jgi:hypothetical protein
MFRHRRSQSHAAPKPGSVSHSGRRSVGGLDCSCAYDFACCSLTSAPENAWSRVHRQLRDVPCFEHAPTCGRPRPLDGQSPHHKIWSSYRCKPIVDTKSQDAARVTKLLHQRRGEHPFSSCSLRCHRIIADPPAAQVCNGSWTSNRHPPRNHRNATALPPVPLSTRFVGMTRPLGTRSEA